MQKSDKPRIPTGVMAVVTWVVLILVLPSLIYLGWVRERKAELTRQNLKFLAITAGRLDNLEHNARRSARNLAMHPEFLGEYLLRQPHFGFIEAEDCQDLAGGQMNLHRIDELRVSGAQSGRILFGHF